MSEPKPGRDKIRVLLADDHTILGKGCARCWPEEDDIEVVGEARDGLEAVELVGSSSPTWSSWTWSCRA